MSLSMLRGEIGILSIFRECKEYELLEPELIGFEGNFRVNMYSNAWCQRKNNQIYQITQGSTMELPDDDKPILKIVHDKQTMIQKKCIITLKDRGRVKYYLQNMKTQ